MITRIRKCMLAAGLMATAMTASTMAGAAELPEEIRKQGFMRIGIEATYPPMAYKDPATNERLGANVDLLVAIAKELGVEIQWEELSFEQLVPAITTGRVDFSGSAVGDNPARREKLTFVDYIATGAQLFSTPDQAKGATQVSDFCGRTVAAPRTTTYFSMMPGWSDRYCTSAGKDAIQPMGTAGAAAAKTDLQQGRAAGVILGAEAFVYSLKQTPGGYVAIGDRLSDGMFGLAFAKDKEPLRDAIAAALTKLKDNGTYLEILKKHGLEKQALAEITIDKGQ